MIQHQIQIALAFADGTHMTRTVVMSDHITAALEYAFVEAERTLSEYKPMSPTAFSVSLT